RVTVNLEIFVGKGMGPHILAPVLSMVSIILFTD
ncbi:unnamed protein product, partial [marine sediment metagenome]